MNRTSNFGLEGPRRVVHAAFDPLAKMKSRNFHFAQCPATLLTLLITLLSLSSTPAKARIWSHALSPVEKWVLEQIHKDEAVDLGAKYPNDINSRKLSADLITAVLLGGIPNPQPNERDGIIIRNAVIEGPVDVVNGKISFPVWFDHCLFKGRVDLSSANFSAWLRFTGSTFSDDVNFEFLKVRGGVFNCSGCTFLGGVDLLGAEIDSQFAAQEAKFQNITKTALFNFMKVGDSAFLEGAVFMGPVNFVQAKIGNDFWAPSVQFLSTDKAANFYGIEVANDVNLEYSRFAGPVNFSNAAIGGLFNGNDAKFDETSQGAKFQGMHVAASIFIKKAQFSGTADFRLANVGLNFEASDARFLSTAAGANFNGIKIEGISFFSDAHFNGPVDFTGAKFSGALEAKGATFSSPDGSISFNSMRAIGPVFLNKAVFNGPVNFGGAELSRNLELSGAQFTNVSQKLCFTLHCDGRGLFDGVLFSGTASFADSSFFQLLINGMDRDLPPIQELDLSRCSVKQSLTLDRLRIHRLVAPGVHSDGTVWITNVNVDEYATLADSSLATVDLSGSRWPDHGIKNGEFYLDGMTYQNLRADADDRTSHSILRHLLEQAKYGADIYTNLELQLTHQGYKEDANRIFIAGHRRERRERLHNIDYLWNVLLECLVGYGREPWRAAIPSLLFISIGAFFFRKENMERTSAFDLMHGYHAIIFSVGTFLPFINLYEGRSWKLKHDRRLGIIYQSIHIAMGWILIPIVILSLTNLIR